VAFSFSFSFSSAPPEEPSFLEVHAALNQAAEQGTSKSQLQLQLQLQLQFQFQFQFQFETSPR
jgi:hypothetical protein